jgi:NitT/TauT family transport system ATP-binding protein
MNAVVKLEKVGKRFGRRVVLKDLDLCVHSGQVVGMLGPSGAGKSTVLRMIAGLERPTSGMLTVRSERLGYVFQEPRLLPWSTALENVAYALRAGGSSASDARREAARYLELMGLGGRERAYPHELSGGMRQRVSLARALAIKPDLLLLDEPFNGLDPALRDAMRALLDSALEAGRVTVIHVTHSPAELARCTDFVVRVGPSSADE